MCLGGGPMGALYGGSSADVGRGFPLGFRARMSEVYCAVDRRHAQASPPLAIGISSGAEVNARSRVRAIVMAASHQRHAAELGAGNSSFRSRHERILSWDIGKSAESRGARQGGCRLNHAACFSMLLPAEAALMTASRSGLRVTAPVGVQLRVGPVQRRGLASRACR